jgi:class I fructose-bisphosphate aldolase
VGYTLYVGTPAQPGDFAQYQQVRADARRPGMPLIVWAYPRGSAIDAKGGKDSFYAVDYAARTASELGADVVKVNFPRP